MNLKIDINRILYKILHILSQKRTDRIGIQILQDTNSRILRFGESVTRFEDDRFLTGEGNYVSDIIEPDVAYAKIFRSAHAAGKIIKINVSVAEKLPGVLTVLTGENSNNDDIGSIKAFLKRHKPDGTPNFEPDYLILPRTHIHHIGEALAIVVAEDEQIAENACELIEVEIEPTIPVTNLQDALAHGAPNVWSEEPSNICFQENIGDKDRAKNFFASADHIIEDEFTISRIIASPMETRSAIGYYDQLNNKYLLKTGTQVPHMMQKEIAKNALGLDPNNLQIISPDVGGGFGLKASAQREMVLVLWAAKRVGRPVRWVADRRESFLGDHHGRDNSAKVSLALNSKGDFLGLKVRMLCAIGAYIDSFALHIMVNNIGGLSGPYRIPSYDVEIKGIFTNTQPIAPYRGAGRPEATYCIERIIDIAARRIGFNPIELRRRNMIPTEEMPFDTGLTFTYDSGKFESVMDSALSLADADGFCERKKNARERGLLLGQGLAYAVEIANGPQGTPGHEVAKIYFKENGDARISVGAHNHGQGHETIFKQLAGEFLGLNSKRIEIEFGDTDKIDDGVGTFGSRSAATCGAAIRSASLKIVDQGKSIASEIFEANPQDIIFRDGTFSVQGTDVEINIHDLAKTTTDKPYFNKGLDFTAFSKDSPDDCTFPNACHICEVEIDPDTGFIQLTRYYIADDVGRALNPLLLAGQFHGGIAQGIGQALLEEIVFDKKNGQILTASFMDYCLPRADDLPFFDIVNFDVPSQNTLFGIKGAGEAGTVGSIVAVINAVADALSSAGAEMPKMPLTPERVWKSLKNAK